MKSNAEDSSFLSINIVNVNVKISRNSLEVAVCGFGHLLSSILLKVGNTLGSKNYCLSC